MKSNEEKRLLSFDEINSQLDYTPIELKYKRRKNICKITKIVCACCFSFLALGTFIYFEKAYFGENAEMDYEVGTYTYDYHTGKVDGFEVNETDYIIISEEEMTGPGTFKIEQKEKEYYVYLGIEEIENKELEFKKDLTYIYISTFDDNQITIDFSIKKKIIFLYSFNNQSIHIYYSL